MISIKSLLPFVANFDGKDVIFYFDQKDLSIYSNEVISEQNKLMILEQLKSSIFENQSPAPSFDYEMAMDLEKEFNNMKENHDHRAHELSNIE